MLVRVKIARDHCQEAIRGKSTDSKGPLFSILLARVFFPRGWRFSSTFGYLTRSNIGEENNALLIVCIEMYMYVFRYTRVNKSRIWNQCLNKNSYKILTTPTRLEQLLSDVNEKHAACKAESIIDSFSCVIFFV